MSDELDDDDETLSEVSVEMLQAKLADVCDRIRERRNETDGETGDDQRCACCVKRVQWFARPPSRAAWCQGAHANAPAMLLGCCNPRQTAGFMRGSFQF